MQSPDEMNHLCRAYQISEGKFFPEKKDNRLGGMVPVSLKEFASIFKPLTFIPQFRISKDQMLEGFSIPFSDEKREFTDFPNTSYYSPVSYLPQAFALLALKQLNCSVGALYYGSKFFVFVVWLLSMVFVLKTLPLYKWLFALLFLLPMSLYVTNSYSADIVTNILALILLSQVLKMSFGEQAVTRKQLLALLLLGILLALAKIVYAAMLVLVFIIPLRHFSSKKHKYAALIAIILISFLVAYLWSGMIMKYYTPYSAYNIDYRNEATLHHEANYYEQMGHLRNNGPHFFKVVYNSMFGDKEFYLSSYVGRFGTYMDTPVPFWFFITAFVLIIFIAVNEENTVRFNYFKKGILLFTALVTFSLLILSQHLTWNKIGNDIVDSMQGRYLIPILPLVFMLFSNSFKKIKLNPAWLVVPSVLLGNAYACNMLYERFMKNSALETIEFKCDAEQINDQGLLLTNDPSVQLDGGFMRTSREHRSGEYALMLPADSSRAFVYHFNNIEVGDLVEIFAWQKGETGQLVVEGKGGFCQPFYWINKDIQLTDKNGWKKMQMIFSMFVECEASKGTFHVKNISNTPVYFDDISYCMKKFKK